MAFALGFLLVLALKQLNTSQDQGLGKDPFKVGCQLLKYLFISSTLLNTMYNYFTWLTFLCFSPLGVH